MRITIINQFYPPDEAPTGKLCASLAEHLGRAGHEVTILASIGGYRTAGQASGSAHANIRVVRAWTPRLGKASILRRLTDYAFFYVVAALRALLLPRQDVLVCLTTPPFIVWIALLHRMIHRKARVVLWNMDCYPEVAERCGKLRPGSVLSRLTRWNNRLIFKRLSHLVSLDPAMETLLMPYAPAKRGLPATVIPNWEPAERYPASLNDLPPWEGIDRLRLHGKFIVLYSGNMGVGHTFDAVIDAAERLRDQPDIVFLMVGSGAKRSLLETAVAERSLPNMILHDYVDRDDLPAMLNSASVALITLHDWALGVMSPSKLHANLAMALPVVYVGPEQSNVDHAIKTFDCGISLRHDQGEALADALRCLRDQPAELQRLAANARRAFDQAYCDTQTLPQFEAVLTGRVG